MRWAPQDENRPPDLPGRTLRLILNLDLGETARGTVGPPDGPRVSFHGWIGLMSAIHQFSTEAGQAPLHPQRPPDDLP